MTGPENSIVVEIHAQLLFHFLPDIDLSEDAEALLFQRFGHPLKGLIEAQRKYLLEIVVHEASLDS